MREERGQREVDGGRCCEEKEEKKTNRPETFTHFSRNQPHQQTRDSANDRRVLSLVVSEVDVLLLGRKGGRSGGSEKQEKGIEIDERRGNGEEGDGDGP
jgi:hypothetical protein